MRGVTFVASLCLAVSLGAVTSPAALTSDEFRCQNTVAKQGRKLFKKTFKFLAKCEDKISKGDIPRGTNCSLEADTAAKILDAQGKFSDQVLDKCSDPVVSTLDFGGTCFGVTTAAALVTCATTEHNDAARTLVDIVYFDTGGRCNGGTNNGNPCTTDANCPPAMVGVCEPLNAEMRKCQKLVGKTVVKQANKRMAALQSCKKKMAKDKIPDDASCVANQSTKLSDIMAKSVAKIDLSCTDAVTASLRFGDVCNGQTATDALSACSLCLDDRETDDLITVQYGSTPRGGPAEVVQVTNVSECVGGPLSRCQVGDYLLANDKIRVVVQSLQRNLFSIGQFGGQIIDADLVRTVGPDRDNFEEWSVALNVENTAHYTTLSIINDGSNGGPAVLRATGVDDILDFLNPSSVVAGFGLSLPASVDDKNLPVTVQTDYILEPGRNYVRVETTVQNTSAVALPIFFGEFLNGSGEVELFQPGYGFGEPLVQTACPVTPYNLCNFVAYSGEKNAEGVSYGYIHEINKSTTFTTSGVTVPQLGVEVILALTGLAGPPITVPALGNRKFTRYFVVGGGTVSAITDTRNEIRCLPTGILQGMVTADGLPTAGIDISVLGNVADGPQTAGLPATTTPARNVVTHTRTTTFGAYSLTLPPGNYDVVASLDGSPYEGGGSSPVVHPVVITAFGTVTENIALPATGSLQVTVAEPGPNPIPAKVSVVGFDPSPDPFNPQTIFGGFANNNTAVFGERSEDGNPYGVTKTLFIDPSGDSGVVPIEPPTDPSGYQVFVSRGPEYSVSSTNVTPAQVTAGATVNATIERVIDSTGFIAADFHVHSIASPDSEVANVDRVGTMMAEGLDFFTPTDHDIIVDFTSAVADAGGTGLIGIANGQEITTFDYGHFNAWPLVIDPAQVNGGAVDHGGAAPPGDDFPFAPFNSFSVTPAGIIALAKTPLQPAATTVQINHIHSHFGLDGGSGLAIDTGLTPPQSSVPPAARRLDPAVTNYFTDTFDALEIWIGDNRQQMFDNFLGEVPTGNGGNIGDWFNLINQGIVRTGVADSDTHNRIINVAGFPRNMVASLEDDPGSLSPEAANLSQNVNDGRVVGTNGPVVRLTAYASSTGESGGLEVGRCTGVVPCTNVTDCPPCTDDAQCSVGETCTPLPTEIATNDGGVDITIDIQSPTWAPFDTVEVYVNPFTTKRTILDVASGAGDVDVNRYELDTPTATYNPVVNTVPVGGSNRLEASVQHSIVGAIEDLWVVVLVRGTDGVSEPLFPIVPNSLTQGSNTTVAQLTDGNLGENGITALAFTNPIRIDVDGGGWTAPGVQVTNP